MGLTADLLDLESHVIDSPWQQETRVIAVLAQLESDELVLFCAEQIFTGLVIYSNLWATSCTMSGGILPKV